MTGSTAAEVPVAPDGCAGAPELTEAEVNAAAEYMLMLTFPEQPTDAR